MNASDDPGWRPALRGLLYVPVLPVLFLLWARNAARRPRLVLIRTVHVAVCAALPLLLWSVAKLGIDPDAGIPWWAWVLLAYPFVATVYFDRSTARKVMSAETIEVAAERFVAGYVIALGLACAPALFGHSFVYVGAGTPAAVSGNVVSAVLLVYIAPSRRRLSSIESRLAERGRAAELTAQMMSPDRIWPARPQPDRR